jgi:hypothetical protein
MEKCSWYFKCHNCTSKVQYVIHFSSRRRRRKSRVKSFSYTSHLEGVHYPSHGIVTADGQVDCITHIYHVPSYTINKTTF